MTLGPFWCSKPPTEMSMEYYSHFKGEKEIWRHTEVQEAEEFIFNIPLDPEIVYLPKNLTDGDVWWGKGGRNEFCKPELC